MTTGKQADAAATLYTLARIYDVGAQFLAARPANRTGYQGYLDALYGVQSRDWFMVLNYALLGCLIALGLAVLWALQ